jgi:hypothetical protein
MIVKDYQDNCGTRRENKYTLWGGICFDFNVYTLIINIKEIT